MGSSASAAKKSESAPSSAKSRPNEPVKIVVAPIKTEPTPKVAAAPVKKVESPVKTPPKSDVASTSAADPNINDEIAFETFYHKNGKTYCCMYTNGVRHYLEDFKSGEWREFPFHWYDEGTLVTDEIHSSNTNETPIEKTELSTEHEEIRSALLKKADEREGIIKIPGRPTYQTYIFEHRRNIHCYYDPEESAWMKLPIRWELTTELAKRLVSKIQKVVPQWHDECDILASLRYSNYNIDDCVNTYHATIGKIETDSPSGGKEKSIIAESNNLEELTVKYKSAMKRIQSLESELESVKKENDNLSVQVVNYEQEIASSQANCESALLQLQTFQKSRPKSAAPNKTANILLEGMDGMQTSLSQMKAVQIQHKADMSELKKVIAQFIGQIRDQTVTLTKRMTSSEGQVEEYRVLYRREALQRKLLYNQLQELRGNIRVFCRVRHDPSTAGNTPIRCVDDGTLEVNSGGQKRLFQFDRAFDVESTQEQVFSEVQPIISSCADGYNICILAYGQTGSGKTFTMQGPSNNPGVNVRSVKELLRICQDRQETISYTLQLSMVEIYNDNIQDLLSPKVDTVELKAQGQKVFLANITEKPVETEDDIFSIIKLGESNRKVASTKMNSTSSRSHLLVLLTVVGVDKISQVSTRGQLTMCDLAGSERVSKTEAQGARLTEAAFINKSLSSLGQVFSALSSNQLHVPYRNSKLTHILQPSLGGDAKTALFVNVSPDVSNAPESISTMQFGSNARQVTLGQAKKHVEKAPNK